MVSGRGLAALLVCCVFLSGLGMPARGEGAPDVRVLIDISGSMRRSDPDNLRRPALELLAALYPLDSRGGFWMFGQEVEETVPHGRVDERWRERALAAAARIRSDSAYTDIPRALEAAAFDRARRQPGQVSHIILLTDGFVDVGPGEEEDELALRYLLDELLPALRAGGYVLHTVAFTEHADHELMQRLAVDSGGMALVAQRAEELGRIFLEALDSAAPAPRLPLEGNTFRVDDGIRELTVLVLQEETSSPLRLQAPGGESHSAGGHGDDMRWQRGEGYELVTIQQPAVGTWVLSEAPPPGSRVTIVSDLRLSLGALPSTRFTTPDARLEARMLDGERVIDDGGFLGVVQMRAELLREGDRRRWLLPLGGERRVPPGGMYRAALPMLAQPGEYLLQVTADGGTFQRQEQRRMVVVPPFEAALEADAGHPGVHWLQARLLHPDVDLDSTEFLLRLRTPDGRGSGRALQAVAERRWQARLDGLDEPGVYELYVEVSGRLHNGEPLAFIGEALQLRVEPAAPAGAGPGLPVPEKTAPAAEGRDEAAIRRGSSRLFWLLPLALLLIAASAGLAWRMLRRARPGELPLDLESPAQQGAAVDDAAGAGGAESPGPSAREDVAALLDALDDPLDLPDDIADAPAPGAEDGTERKP